MKNKLKEILFKNIQYINRYKLNFATFEFKINKISNLIINCYLKIIIFHF
jgi:hypothetical protein